ncbi:MAG: DUF6456 domain-containing protein [Parvibaculales bacterium]
MLIKPFSSNNQNKLNRPKPGLADLAVELCCSDSGLEAMEKKYALPRRSAKIMLKLALMRLSVHYGYQSASAAAASFRIR